MSSLGQTNQLKKLKETSFFSFKNLKSKQQVTLQEKIQERTLIV